MNHAMPVLEILTIIALAILLLRACRAWDHDRQARIEFAAAERERAAMTVQNDVDVVEHLTVMLDREATRRAELEQELADLIAERDSGGYDRLVGLLVTVSMRDATIVRGILSAVYRDAIVLAQPEALNAGNPTNVGAEMTLERARIGAVTRHHAGGDGDQDGGA